ncbi:MAG: EAL domain-containing protein [Leptospiraceae bacterium]|nr:EAL domain-containing protein [Leptospiraceae bacterium]MCP5497455.1 EAL domain-containing protein [Leptospiraceae bacterium]
MENWKSEKDEWNEVILDAVIGISNTNETSIQIKLKEADTAWMYAKEHRLSYKFYDESMDQEKTHKNNFLWIKKVRKALEEERVFVQFQAIQNNQTQKIEKYEALVRIHETDGTIVPPGMFLPTITESKLYVDLTYRIIEKVCFLLNDFSQECSININAEHLIDFNLSEVILKHVNKYKIRNRLVVEILESEKIENYGIVLEKLNLLKSQGVKIAIDDFGTGYSNFEHIIKLPIDYIKIDGSLIKNIHKDKVSKTLVKNIVNICNTLKIKTIAEFVHCKEVQDIVLFLGVDYSQGYYIGKPTETPWKAK